MLWVAVDLALVLLVLGALVGVLLRVWRVLKRLGGQVADAGSLVAQATSALEALQVPGKADQRGVRS